MTGNDATVPDLRRHVVVIGGGRSSEHDVSRSSASSIAGNLDPARYQVTSLTIGRDGGWLDGDDRPLAASEAVALLERADVAFPALHGPNGEDGAAAGLLTLLGVPYVGSTVRAGALGMDKDVTKFVAAQHGVRTARDVTLHRGSAAADPAAGAARFEPEVAGIVAQVGMPAVVKPRAAGSSYGVSVVQRPEDLAAAIEAAFDHDDVVLVEEFVAGLEVDIAVVGRADGSLLVSEPLLIHLDDGQWFDYDTKYGGGARFEIPAPLTAPQRAAVESTARTMFTALDCAGVARVDFFITDDDVVLNEVNTMPGFTATSQVPRMFAAQGIDYPALLDLLIDDAIARARQA